MNQSMSSSFGKRKKVLVICVDRDDDVGIKTTEQTPALGREKCLEIASKLALADPEDADSNTISSVQSSTNAMKDSTETDQF